MRIQTRVGAWGWVLAVGCAQAPTDPCVPMCDAAADRYTECLADWTVEWSSAGYQDRGDFIDACETWAWQMRLIEREVDEVGATDTVCTDRTVVLETGSCADFLEIDWQESPGMTTVR